VIVAAAGTAFPGATNLSAQKALVAFVCIYIFFFASSWGPVACKSTKLLCIVFLSKPFNLMLIRFIKGVVTGEIFPLGVRAKGLSMTTASNWLLNWAIAYSTPFLVNPGKGNANLVSEMIWAQYLGLGHTDSENL